MCSARLPPSRACLLTLSSPTYVDHPTLYEYNPAAAATVGATLYARQHEMLNDPFVDATNATLKPVHQARILRGGPAWREGNYAAHHAPTTPTLATGDHGGLER